MLLRLLGLAALLFGLLGCAAGGPPDATLAEVQRRAYAPSGPSSVTLVTVRDVRSDGGAHTGLIIRGSETVIWDPAGSFRHPAVPEIGDVLFGVTPMIERVYIDYHVRPAYYMTLQTLPVSRNAADALIARSRRAGPALHATCARVTSRILREAGYDVTRTWFPVTLMNSFGALPGVTSRRIDMTNVDTNHNVVFGQGGVPLPPA